MDFTTRDRYRHVVEAIARLSAGSEAEVAQQAVTLAGAAVGVPSSSTDAAADARRAHVGYYLVDDGPAGARARAPASGRRRWPGCARGGRAHPLALYAGTIVPDHAGADRRAADPRAPGRGLAVVGRRRLRGRAADRHEPARGRARQLAGRRCSSTPRPLPRLDFTPASRRRSRTLVVVPTMLGSAEGIDALVEALEVRFLANRDPQPALRAAHRLPRRRRGAPARRRRARSRPRARASRRSTTSTGAGHGGDARHLLPLPPAAPLERRASASGWATSASAASSRTSTRCCAARRRRGRALRLRRRRPSRRLPAVRYVITLDTDTQLPRDAARAAGRRRMAHPLNRPRFDRDRAGVVVEGYGILQPRVGVSLPSADRSRLRAAVRRRARASTRTRARSPTSTRTCSAKARSSARASTTSTPSSARWRGACPRTASSATTCSRAATRAPAWSATWSCSRTTPSRYSADVSAPPPLDPRRLADRSAGCAPRLRGLPGGAAAIRSRRCRAGRSSTTCGAAWCRPRCC